MFHLKAAEFFLKTLKEKTQFMTEAVILYEILFISFAYD